MSFLSFESVHLGFLGGFMWRLQKEPPISNSKIVHTTYCFAIIHYLVVVHGTYLILSSGGRSWWVTFIIRTDKGRSIWHTYILSLCCNEIVVICLASQPLLPALMRYTLFKNYGVIFSIFLVKLFRKN
jgi:hypothetical protein